MVCSGGSARLRALEGLKEPGFASPGNGTMGGALAFEKKRMRLGASLKQVHTVPVQYLSSGEQEYRHTLYSFTHAVTVWRRLYWRCSVIHSRSGDGDVLCLRCTVPIQQRWGEGGVRTVALTISMNPCEEAIQSADDDSLALTRTADTSRGKVRATSEHRHAPG